MGSGGSSQAAKRAVSANTAEAVQTEAEGWSANMPTVQEHTSPEVGIAPSSKLCNEILTSISLVFTRFSQHGGVPAEQLGHAMRILGMNPTEDQVHKHLADLGRPKYIDQTTFHRFIKDELTKYFERVQAVVDYLKQYDKDNSGTLSSAEVQAAIRGSELSQEKLQASVAKMPSNSKGHLDIVELATCFLELGDSEEMLEPTSEAAKDKASASEADSKAVEIQVVKDAVSAEVAKADKTDAEQCRDTQAAEESASGPAAYSTMFNEITASTDAVFRYFSQPSGVPPERLGHAMRILGMNRTEDEVEKHLADLGGPKYIDHTMFHRFIEEELRKLIPKVQELLDYLKEFDKDGKGALSEEELQEVMRGSELSQDKVQASLRKLPRNSEGHLDIVKLSKYFLELGDSQVGTEDWIPGTEAPARQDVASQVREAIANAADAEARYNLKDPQAFAQFLQDSDVRLVRAKYLADLVLSKRPLPRRQEAETEHFKCGGETLSALVTHEEVQNWANGTQDAIICSISHAWETREHPDPCRHQLQHIVNHTGLYGAAFKADVWVFYDYASLFQYERTPNSHEERSFRKAMGNMHLMYAHESTLTLRIETLTPEHVWNTMMADEQSLVRVYDADTKTLKEKPLKCLKENRTPYKDRGWCMAEIEWSSLRGVNAQHQQIDRLETERQKSDDLNGRVPMTPENFKHQMEQAKFTHRSDADAVIYLQEKIFREKVTECQHLVLEGLPAQEISALVHALPHYQNLKSLKLRRFQCGEEEATSLAKALASSQVETLEISSGMGESGLFMVKALAEALKTNSSVRDMDLAENNINAEGAQALAEALKTNSSVRDINLADNIICAEGAQALAEALKTNSSVRDLNLAWNKIGAEGAQALAEALKTNSSVRDMDLAENNIGAEGAQALAEALKANSPVRDMDLSGNWIGDEGAQALAEALKTNSSVRDMDLAENSIGAEGAQALAEALKTNSSVRDMNLRQNRIGYKGAQALADALQRKTSVRDTTLVDSDLDDKGAKESADQVHGRRPFEAPVRLKALAEALKTNTSVTSMGLFEYSIGVEGAQAVAEALKTNTSVTSINLRDQHIADEGAQAIAEALKTNTSVTSINLSDNFIGVEGAQAIAEALKTNTSVTSINLSDNFIGVEGAQAVAEALKTNTSVTSIDLSHNFFGVEGAQACQAFAEALKTNTSVTSINLSHNFFGVEGAQALAEALKTNTSVTSIDLTGNSIRVQGAQALAKALKTNASVMLVSLQSNSIGDEGVQALKQVIEERKKMGFELDIRFH